MAVSDPRPSVALELAGAEAGNVGATGHTTAKKGRRSRVLASVPRMPTQNDTIRVFVEIPKASRNKYRWDEESGTIVLDRRLFAAVTYPTDYGFIPETIAGDGDELDAMVAVTEPTFPGCSIPAKPIAVLRCTTAKCATTRC